MTEFRRRVRTESEGNIERSAPIATGRCIVANAVSRVRYHFASVVRAADSLSSRRALEASRELRARRA